MSLLEEWKNEIKTDEKAIQYYEVENQLLDLKRTLKKIRIDKELTQMDVSKRTGLSQSMISKMETYSGNPTLDTFITYCNCIGINLSELIKEKELKY